MKSLIDYFESLPDRQRLAVCLLLNLILGVIDSITKDYSLTLFYLLPIAFASWFVGKRAGFFIAMVSSAELLIIDQLITPKRISVVSIRFWDAVMEICYLLLTGYLFFKIRDEMELSRQKSMELEVANRELEAFNYTVAHDLRKPLAVVNGYCQAIRELCGDKLSEQCKGYLQEAYAGTWRMNTLIDSLLNFSRFTSVELRRQPVDLSEIAKLVAAELRMAEPARRVAFRIAEGMTVNGDADLLKVVLSNLLGNAWKYTAMREEAVIEVGMTEVNGNPACFVHDNGPGFAMADAEKLFIPFQRLPGAEEFGGHGIGLATVERIIRRHGGRVWAEGVPGKGATFYFTLGSSGTA